MAKRYWLLKSEPSTFSIQDLAAAPGRTTGWDGVRNFQARNMLRDEIQVGDGILFYHSSTNPPAVVGRAEVVRAGYPDASQFDKKSSHFDPDARPDDPRWYAIDVRFVDELPRAVPLDELRKVSGLREMVLLRKGSRLSVQPVTADEWKIVLGLGGGAAGSGLRRG